MIEVNTEDRNFAPTIEWMRRRYYEMNDILFKGELGECDFKIFTTGKGSQGRTLGWFGMQAPVKVRRRHRRMFVETHYPYYDEIIIDSNNFAAVCRPQIQLNGNYTGTEYGFLATLVHEMCHYYTYMRGWAPTQAHGREFRTIGEIVSYRSNDLFTIQRLATAEDMSHLDLNDEMKEKKEKRVESKKSKIMAVFQFNKNGGIRLTTTSSKSVIDEICDFTRIRPSVKEVVVTNDIDIIELLFKMGYNVNMRTWRYWDVDRETKILSLLKNTENKKVISNPNFVTESRRTTSEIINEVLKRFIEDKENGDIITIEPGMNLGELSPFEI